VVLGLVLPMLPAAAQVFTVEISPPPAPLTVIEVVEAGNGAELVLRRTYMTLVRDSLIYDCGIGTSAYASTNLVLINNTVADCATGILFRNNPTRAVGVATNLIVWRNTTNVSVLQTSQLDFSFSNIEGMLPPGEGNISSDPMFLPTNDYHDLLHHRLHLLHPHLQRMLRRLPSF
jgi:hypothetical protein